MIINSIDGKKLYESKARTIRAALEEAVEDQANLSCADLRKANLKYANLDGLVAPGSCLWGADLRGADLADSCLPGCDLRHACLDSTCLAHANLCQADLRGAYFCHTILENTDLNETKISCLSFFDCDLRTVRNLDNSTFLHWGEEEIPLNQLPVIIRGLEQNIIVAGEVFIRGTQVLRLQDMNAASHAACSLLRTTIDVLRYTDFGEMQTLPNPKIPSGKGVI